MNNLAQEVIDGATEVLDGLGIKKERIQKDESGVLRVMSEEDMKKDDDDKEKDKEKDKKKDDDDDKEKGKKPYEK